MTVDSLTEIQSVGTEQKFEGLRKINSHDGWITPTGTFYGCDPQDHDVCAKYLLETNKAFVESRLDQNNKYQMLGNTDDFSPREVLKAAGYALLSDNLLVDSNLPENLSLKQLDLIKRANLELPKMENNLDFDTYKEIQKLASGEIDKYISGQKYFSDDSEPIRSLKMVVRDPTFVVHGEESSESLEQTYELLTKNYKAEQRLIMGKGVTTWRLIETPSNKQVVIELVYHDHAQGDDDYGFPTEEWWMSFKSKVSVDDFLKSEMASGKHSGWHLEGSLEVK